MVKRKSNGESAKAAIDDIFAVKPKEKDKEIVAADDKLKKQNVIKNMIGKIRDNKHSKKIKIDSDPLVQMLSSRASSSGDRKFVDGVKVYSEEELRLNSNGGDTEDCPFDCNCCF